MGLPANTGSHRLAQLIRDRCAELGKTMADVSRETGYSESYMSRLVKPERLPSPEAAEALAKALEVTTDDIFAASGKLPEDLEQALPDLTVEQIENIRIIMIPPVPV